MSLQEMKDLKQHYLDEMLSLSNDLGIKDYRNEKIDIRFRRECEYMIDELKGKFNGMSIEINKKKELHRLEQVAYPSQRFKSFCYDDDDDYDYEERSIPLRDIISKLPPSIAMIPVLPTLDSYDSLIMGNEELNTIPENDSDEVIKSSVEDFVPVPSESEDTSRSDSYDDESLSDEDVPEDNFKIYSNPLFEFNDEYISSDVNPFFDEVLENIESKNSYVSTLDEPALLVTPLFDANKDECFDPGGDIDEIDAFLDMDISTDIENGYHDSEGDIIYLESLLIDDTILNLPPKELLDHNPRSLKDEPDNDNLKSMVKIFDPGIREKIFSSTYVRLSFEDRHYLSLTYVIRIFFPYFIYLMNSSFPLSSGSEDIIFDPDISAFHFSSLKPVAYEYLLEVSSSTCFVPKYHDDMGRVKLETHTKISASIALDYEDSRAREIPSGESKVYIEVLSVLWGNRLPIPDGSLPLSRYMVKIYSERLMTLTGIYSFSELFYILTYRDLVSFETYDSLKEKKARKEDDADVVSISMMVKTIKESMTVF
ncbi:hypothetical protein Tco_1043180 [Tanacetum coccineum]|uniref:Uncharacterized protein n=1 Tax=Tanacetum coccineum TaxID=301880 RepID=A0ABQ5GMJ8_9ASTR